MSLYLMYRATRV